MHFLEKSKIMKTFHSHKVLSTQSNSDKNTSSEENGQKVTPPDYGLDFVDQQNEIIQPMMDTPLANPQPASLPSNNTGLPDNLKAGVESLSGYSMDDVKVHYNSSMPAKINALAYSQGMDIFLGPGQKEHLPHETWHAAQKKQGRVRANTSFMGMPGNDDAKLEKEADEMGKKALSHHIENNNNTIANPQKSNNSSQTKQFKVSQEIATNSHSMKPTNQRMVDQNLNSSVIQRRLDFRLEETPILKRAINIFQEIESEDLTLEEFNMLKTERQRFMPLLGRFASATNTKLLVSNGIKKRTGDFAVTELFCITNENKEYEYDNNKDEFNNAVQTKSISSFTISVLFNIKLVRVKDDPKGNSSLGAILQAFTHELSVHAENMLDYTEDYWEYNNGTRDTPPALLGTSSDEHKTFKEHAVKRYEYMSNRAKNRSNQIGQEFHDREFFDLRSAK